MTSFGSRNARCANANETPCLSRFARSLIGSHSKLGSLAIVWILYHILIWRNLPTDKGPQMRLTPAFAGVSGGPDGAVKNTRGQALAMCYGAHSVRPKRR